MSQADARVDPALSSCRVHAAVDAAYHEKYDRHGPRIVGTVTSPHVTGETLRLLSQG